MLITLDLDVDIITRLQHLATHVEALPGLDQLTRLDPLQKTLWTALLSGIAQLENSFPELAPINIR